MSRQHPRLFATFGDVQHRNLWIQARSGVTAVATGLEHTTAQFHACQWSGGVVNQHGVSCAGLQQSLDALLTRCAPCYHIASWRLGPKFCVEPVRTSNPYLVAEWANDIHNAAQQGTRSKFDKGFGAQTQTVALTCGRYESGGGQ